MFQCSVGSAARRRDDETTRRCGGALIVSLPPHSVLLAVPHLTSPTHYQQEQRQAKEGWREWDSDEARARARQRALRVRLLSEGPQHVAAGQVQRVSGFRSVSGVLCGRGGAESAQEHARVSDRGRPVHAGVHNGLGHRRGDAAVGGDRAVWVALEAGGKSRGAAGGGLQGPLLRGVHRHRVVSKAVQGGDGVDDGGRDQSDDGGEAGGVCAQDGANEERDQAAGGQGGGRVGGGVVAGRHAERDGRIGRGGWGHRQDGDD